MILDLDEALAEIGSAAATSSRRRYSRVWALIQIGFTAIVATAMWWLVGSLLGSPHHWLHSLFLPALVVLLIGLFVLRNDYRWSRPMQRLLELAAAAREGDIPIEELSQVKGGPAPLVELLQHLLRDLRAQKLAVAEMNEETRQRIASRTVALERQIGSLRQQAVRDALTGLFNRRMFDVCLPKLAKRCVTDRLELSVLAIDVDNFKILNDTLGHAVGDQLLRDIGQIIRSGIRDKDAAFRVGGDEFVVILSETDAEHAGGLARRLAELVNALAKPLRVAKPPRLSIGIAAISELPNGTGEALMKLADQRLYAAKSTRRPTAPAMPLARSA